MTRRRASSGSDADWDVVVVGAGPAGAVAARQLALSGASVLLVDKARFPRDKVCGCCLGAAARGALAAAGLGDLPDRLGARPLRDVWLASDGRAATVRLRGRLCLSRRRFDAALAESAAAAGATFHDGTFAEWVSSGAEGVRLTLRRAGVRTAVRARMLLVADGLAGRSLDAHPGCAPSVRRWSRIGAAVTLDEAPDEYPGGRIFMAVGAGGYVGLVRLEDGLLDVAAAFDPAFVRSSGGPGRAANLILAEAGLWPIDALAGARWLGTPKLTRRRVPAAERILVLGDAAGYAEPFTGEGIGWALASGIAAAPLALEGACRWRPSLAEEWGRRHAGIVRRRQRACLAMALALRSQTLTRWAVRALTIAPAAARPFVRRIDAAPDGRHGGTAAPEVFA